MERLEKKRTARDKVQPTSSLVNDSIGVLRISSRAKAHVLIRGC
jgi:hypothetical protein